MFLHKVYKIGRIGRMGLIGRIRTAQIKFRTVQILQYHFFVVPLQADTRTTQMPCQICAELHC